MAGLFYLLLYSNQSKVWGWFLVWILFGGLVFLVLVWFFVVGCGGVLGFF